MKPTISLLSDSTINKIAAGEVIESPASVVKELVENGLDAKATRIDVEIVGGGLGKIIVSDDGIGMNREDAQLSLLRHATSKIRSSEDLFALATMGFRGEALASISAVSKLTLLTAVEGTAGTKIEVVGGEVMKRGMGARSRGTTLEISSLFFNVPARKKFQKSAQALSAEIYRLMTSLALSHPKVGFSLISNGKKTLDLFPSGDLLSRASQLLGSEAMSQSIPIELFGENLSLSGFLGAPHQSRPNRMNQYLFLNSRAIFSPLLSDAIRDGYGTRLSERRHPLFLLHVSLPPERVDVNVHPQKLEVRLVDEEEVRAKLIEAVSRAFAPALHSVQLSVSSTSFFKEETPSFFSPSFQEEREEELLDLPFEMTPEPLGIVSPYLLMRGEAFRMLALPLAEERIAYDRMKEDLAGSRVEQGLLFPLEIKVTPVEGAMLLTHQVGIEQVGFRFRMVDTGLFLVEAIPPFIKEEEVALLLSEIGSELKELIGAPRYEEKRKEKLALLLSRYAKKRGSYSLEEGLAIYKELQKSRDPLFSPRGEKIEIEVSYDKIQRLFQEN